jgi:hypothetical protein
MKRSALVVLAAVGTAVAAVALIATASAVDQEAVIDFEGLAEGAVVSSLDCTSGGVTCTADPGGSISVFGLNPALAGNQAMIFDSDCAGGCSGGDTDLNIGQGNVLIVSEDGDSTDPDDADVLGERFDIDFSAFGEGTVEVTSIDVADIELEEGGAFVDLFAGAAFTGFIVRVDLPQTGDGVVQTVAIGVSGVASMQVVLNGSGAIDNLRVRPEHELPAFARITGGGWRVTGSNGESVRSSNGLTLHCDLTLANNLQVNWDGGNKWHINKVVDAAFCFDDPAFTPEPPAAPADTYVGLDVGKLNNADGAVACFILADHGEVAGDPDGPDQALIRIWDVGFDPGITADDLDDPGFDCLASSSDPYTDPNTVLFVPLSDVSGNLQFHFDQPHKGNNN